MIRRHANRTIAFVPKRRQVLPRTLSLTLISVVSGLALCRAAKPECSPVAPVYAKAMPPPRILYTDIQSGPTSSGEDNLGIYLSIFGVHFWNGASTAKSHVKVLAGGRPVAAYRYLGPSRGLPGVQQITVQIGPAPSRSLAGYPLPLVVVRDGMRSNSDITFTPNPGQTYFVDNLHGNDSTAFPEISLIPIAASRLPIPATVASGLL